MDYIIGCYHIYCPNHSGDHPFCTQKECTATVDELEEYEEIRRQYMSGQYIMENEE